VSIRQVKDRLRKRVEAYLIERANALILEELAIANPDIDITVLKEELTLGKWDDFVLKSGKQKSDPTVKDYRLTMVKKELETVIATCDQLVKNRGIFEAEEFGIVYVDEIDKVVRSSRNFNSSDAADEGVQRDLLPLIEGCKIKTDFGEVDTSRILFICAGAFITAKPQNLLAELQGRLPIRIQLKSLTQAELYRVLIEPEVPVILKEKSLLKTEGVDIQFTDPALLSIAEAAYNANNTIENIGARRLLTVLERVVEDISYNVEDYRGTPFIIDEPYVHERLKALDKEVDLKKYIL